MLESLVHFFCVCVFQVFLLITKSFSCQIFSNLWRNFQLVKTHPERNWAFAQLGVGLSDITPATTLETFFSVLIAFRSQSRRVEGTGLAMRDGDIFNGWIYTPTWWSNWKLANYSKRRNIELGKHKFSGEPWETLGVYQQSDEDVCWKEGIDSKTDGWYICWSFDGRIESRFAETTFAGSSLSTWIVIFTWQVRSNTCHTSILLNHQFKGSLSRRHRQIVMLRLRCMFQHEVPQVFDLEKCDFSLWS